MRQPIELDSDPVLARVAAYLEEWLNQAVVGVALVGLAVIEDVFPAYLETEQNFPLLQVSRGFARSDSGEDRAILKVEYVLPSGLELMTDRPGWRYVVAKEIKAALRNLQDEPSILGNCSSVAGIEIDFVYYEFSTEIYPAISTRIEIGGEF